MLFLMTLACAVPALGQMMYNPPAAGGAPAASPASPPAVQPNAYQPSRQGTPSPCTAMSFLS